jgi:branched-chain amino acid transport system permease protein
VWGAVLGAAVITVLKEWLTDVLPQLLGSSGNYEVIVLSILTIILLQRAPEGLWPLLTGRFSRRQSAPKTASSDAAESPNAYCAG